MSANKKQIGGDHYTKHRIQHWDYAWEHEFDQFQYCITKYVERWKDKNGLEDLYKARHHLEKYIELAEAEAESIALSQLEEVEGQSVVAPLRPLEKPCECIFKYQEYSKKTGSRVTKFGYTCSCADPIKRNNAAVYCQRMNEDDEYTL